jgi:hypothetical protein
LSDGRVKRGFSDFEPSRSFTNSEALSRERTGAPEFFVSDDRLASALATPRHCCIEAGAGSLTDEVALELPERAENRKD